MRLPLFHLISWLLASKMASGTGNSNPLKCVMYLTGQHPNIPPLRDVRHVTHVALAFMQSSIFNEDNRSIWPLFMDVKEVRAQFMPGTKVMVAIGGWGDTEGFSIAARADPDRFARNVARMVADTGADGVDIDWEYPGGNGEDYKQIPNDMKAWEIDAYPLLLAAIRRALGPRKLISAAVPGKPVDMMAFTRETVPRIMNHVDFLNVMTYDLMNRRDTVTIHHTGVKNSIEVINAYVAAGAAPQSLNLGFAFYVKWFRTEPGSCTKESSLGCQTTLMEDPLTGADLGQAGAFSWVDPIPEALDPSFGRALKEGTYDEDQGGYYYWDAEENIFWSFDTHTAIQLKFSKIVAKTRVGGVFAWGLGEDATFYEHLEAVNDGIEELGRGRRESKIEL